MLTENKKLVESFFFVLLLILVFFILNYHEILFLRPMSIHAWAQCDRASVARCYFQDSMNFFKPRTHYLSNNDGVTGLEFPLMNYLAAVCYKLFGFNEFWYRALSLAAISIGLYFTFCIARLFIQNALLAALISLSWYLSPVLCYYSPNFLSDAASLGFIMSAWYFYFRYREQQNKRNLVLFFLFAACASLIKITSLISVCVILIITIMDYFSNRVHLFKRLLKQTSVQRIKIIACVISIFLLVIGWYQYAAVLNSKIADKIFLVGINPPQSWSDFPWVWNDIKNLWLPYYYHWIMYVVYAIALITLMVRFKKMHPLLRLITVGVGVGNCCFVLLLFNQYRLHDYYIIALLPFFFFLLIAVVHYLQTIALKQKQLQFILCTVLLLICCISTWWCKIYLHDKYAEDHYAYYNIENYMESFGVKPHDKVIAGYDLSFNIQLYLMNRKGWRIQNEKIDPKAIQRYIQMGAKFIVLNDVNAINNPLLKPFLKKETGEFLGVHIFILQ